MTTTRVQLLGWIEHCEREHPGKGTNIPTWLCSMDAVHEAEGEGFVQGIGEASLGPRHGSVLIYGLTDKGRAEFYKALPCAGQSMSEIDPRETISAPHQSAAAEKE